jgi:hypothetical protein
MTLNWKSLYLYTPGMLLEHVESYEHQEKTQPR